MHTYKTRGYDVWQTQREKAEILNCGLKVLRDVRNPLRPILLIWKPRASKPFGHYSFRSIEQMEDHIIKAIEHMKVHDEQTQRYKAQRQGTPEMLASVTPGMIFYSSWGYDQTNIDFYQIIRVTGKMAVIQELAQFDPANASGHGMDSSMCMPLKDRFRGEAMEKRIQFSDGKPCFRIASYAYASLWDGKAKNYSWGH